MRARRTYLSNAKFLRQCLYRSVAAYNEIVSIKLIKFGARKFNAVINERPETPRKLLLIALTYMGFRKFSSDLFIFSSFV